MFPRISETRAKGKLYRYVKIVENYWYKGQSRQKVLANLGSLEKFKHKELEKLIKGLCHICEREDLNVQNLKNQGSPHYGDILLARHLWKELGLDTLITDYMKSTEVKIPVELCSFLMVANRLIDPLSKLAVFSWYKEKVYLKELENTHLSLHEFYRSMDYLEKMKKNLEKDLYYKLCNLFTLKLNLVFYDTTSSYFEGEGPSIAKHGKSKDHRPDKHQIIIGLLVTDEGVPIAHEVFEGDETDKATVVKTINDLKKRFHLKRVIFVSDRGMVSQANLDYIKEQGFSYIVTLKKRRLNEAKKAIDATFPLLEEKRKSYEEEKESQNEKEAKKETLLFSEYQGKDKVIYLVCLNPEKKKDDKLYREERIKKGKRNLEKIRRSVEKGKLKSREKILKRATLSLDKTNRRYFHYSSLKDGLFSYSLAEETLKEEERLDGIFIIKTTAFDLSSEELIQQYKNLSGVETAFKEIKDFLHLRPIRHYQDERVRAHVFICVLAYLLEKIIEKKLAKTDLSISAREALDKLDDIRLAKNQIGERVFLCPAQGTSIHRKILKVMGVGKIPPILSP